MSKPGIIYRMDWKTVRDNGTEFAMQVSIYDNSVQIDSITGEEIIIQMTPSGHPLKISTDKSEDKFTSIRAKTALLTFLNSDSVNFSTFSTGEDNRFTVTITCASVTIFTGFLQMSDIREPFLTQKDQEVTLTAVDGLAFMKGVPLTDSKGGVFNGLNKIIDYISMALYWGTGLDISINVFNNLREETNPGRWQKAVQFVAPHTIQVSSTTFVKYFKAGHNIIISGSASNNGTKLISSVNEGLATVTLTDTVVNEAVGPVITFEDSTDGGCMYSTCYLDARTFEDKPGTRIDSYTALERILKRDCFIEQVLGAWYIFRVKEFRNDFQQYRTQYNSDGTFNNFASGFNLEKAIGLQALDPTTHLPIPFPGNPDAISFFSQAQTQRTNSRPTGEVKLTYQFETPAEIPCNINFERKSDGGISLPDETDEDGNTAQVFKYTIDCWTLKRGAGTSATTPNCQAYIKRLFVNGYEKQRMVILTLPSSQGNPKNYIESEDIPVGAKDKFTFSFDWGTEVDASGSTINLPVASVWLAGDDGSFWKLQQLPNPAWLTTNSSDEYGLNTDLIYQLDFSQDTSTWVNISIDAPPLPVSGNLRIRLHSSGAFSSSSSDDFNVKFSNVKFDYQPFVNGGYGKYSGQSNKTTRPGNYKLKLDDDVFISNSPKKIFKGALQTYNPDIPSYSLAGRFYDGQEFLYANDGVNHLMSYGEQQIRAVHNQYRNANEVYELTAQGLNGSDCPDLIYGILNRDIEPNTNQKILQLLWIDQDWRNSEWSATMIKNFDNDIGFVGDDTLEFKYEID